jgi:hypothetical protein
LTCQPLKVESDTPFASRHTRVEGGFPDLVALAANLNRMPPLMQHALDVEIVERSAEAFEYLVKKCLWTKAFRDSNAADIGYAMICYPDYAVAWSLNPKLKLSRTKTLMQGDAKCGLRYVMET